MTGSLYGAIYQAIMEPSPALKGELSDQVYQNWINGQLIRDVDFPLEDIDIPGRPDQPELVHPRQVKQRSLATEEGRKVLLHSFAHIEFNAINLALDAAYRFRDMPDDFVTDWLSVAAEEAKHFKLIDDYLMDLGSSYGAFKAHNGLWDMVCRTRHNVLHRMALVPRVMEARGLDVTPGMMEKFRQIKDLRSVDILQVIYQEEIGHVAIGNRWFHYCCKQQQVDSQETFKALIGEYFAGKLRGPFNHEARLAAGFEEYELTAIEQYL